MLPPHIYKYKKYEQEIELERANKFNYTEILTEDTLSFVIEGAEYPMQGVVNTVQLKDMAVFKKILLVTAPFIIFRNQYIKLLNKVLYVLMRGYVLQDKHMTQFGRNFRKLTYTALKEFGIKEEHATPFSEYLSQLIDDDDGYRMRIEDLLTLFKEHNIRQSFKDMQIALLEREHSGKIKRYGSICLKIAILATYIPPLRKKLVKIVNSVQMTKLHLTDQELYWGVLNAKEYKFLGKSHEEHIEDFYRRGLKIPKGVYMLEK